MIMETEQIKDIIVKELPRIIETDPDLRRMVIDICRDRYADRDESNDRFHRMMDELVRQRERSDQRWAEWRQEWKEWREADEKRDREWNEKWERTLAESEKKWNESLRKSDTLREESERRWQESLERHDKLQDESERRWQESLEKYDKLQEESERKWQESLEKDDKLQEESERKWQESQRRWEELRQEAKEDRLAVDKRFQEVHAHINRLENSIGALGARWGILSEQSFRNGLKGILEDSFDVKVVHVNEYDDEGIVFGRPDQVELDLIILNSTLILCELKSSISKGDIFLFERKVQYYEKRHQRKADRMIVISPMVDERAASYARKHGIEIYSHADDIRSL